MDLKRVDNYEGGRVMTIGSSYDELVETLGEPDEVEQHPRWSRKVDVQWRVRDEDTGRVLEVWNYKNGPNYLGEEGTPVEDIESWSGGGSQELAEELGLEVYER